MLQDISLITTYGFIATTLFTVFFIAKASHYNKTAFFIILAWLSVQAFLAGNGFYLKTEVIPPRFLLVLFPALLLIGVLFSTKQGRNWIDNLDPAILTLLHIVRIPVELILYGLFLGGAVPELITFAGRNFDILAGITAPFVYFFGFVKKLLSNRSLLIWNVACLLLLLNVVFYGLLSAPLPIQQFAFEQPNIAMLHAPFVWLPAIIVPIVLFSHLVMIRSLMNKSL